MKTKKELLLKTAAALLALVVLYPLSYGPVYARVLRPYLEIDAGARSMDMLRRLRAVEAFYTPIIAAHRANPAVAHWLDRYLMFWLRVYGVDEDHL